VYDTSFESYEDKYGGIYKLYAENQRLIVFQELKVGAVPVRQVIYNDMQGVSTVGASSEILNPQVIYFAGEFGIGKNPESFAVYGFSKYFVDVKRGAICRLSNDGITPISTAYLLHNSFSTYCDYINEFSGTVRMYGVFDVKYGEYIVSTPGFNLGNKFPVPGFTIAFNEVANEFSSTYSYLAENMCGLGTEIVTFKLGSIYLHDSNALYNNFYAVQYASEVWSILNAEPSNVKVLQAISEETNDAWEVYSIETPNNQSSSLVVGDFEEKENNQYAAVWRDANTPNLVSGTALFEGDPMRDRTFQCKFKYTGTGFNKLFAINYLYEHSNRSNK
jgi:hypothetical protein